MKQIFNWTLGAFFRTLGRFLFFLVVGIFLAFLISKSGLNLPNWLKPLYIVNASAFEDWTSSQSRYRYDDHGTNTYSSWETTPHTWEPTLPVNKIQWRVKYSQGLSNENTYNIKFAYRPIPQAVSPTRIQVYADTGSVEYETITCGQWAYNSDNFNVVQCSFTPRNNISSNTWLIIEVNLTQGYLTSLRTYMNQFEERLGINSVVTQTGNQITNEINDLGDTITNTITENNQNLINIINQNNTTCESLTISKFSSNILAGSLASSCTRSASSSAYITDYIRVNSLSTINVLRNSSYCFYDNTKTPIGNKSTFTSGTLSIPVNASYVRVQFSQSGSYEYSNINTCMSNTESVNDNLNGFKDTFTDTDTSEDSNDVADYLHDFNLSIEGPLTAILNVPIQLLDDLLVDYNSTSSHADLCFTLKGVESCIPSGDILWKRTNSSGVHDYDIPYWFGVPDFVGFRHFFDLVVGGFLTYLLLKKLVNSIEKGLDPTIAEVNIMNL